MPILQSTNNYLIRSFISEYEKKPCFSITFSNIGNKKVENLFIEIKIPEIFFEDFRIPKIEINFDEAEDKNSHINIELSPNDSICRIKVPLLESDGIVTLKFPTINQDISTNIIAYGIDPEISKFGNSQSNSKLLTQITWATWIIYTITLLYLNLFHAPSRIKIFEAKTIFQISNIISFIGFYKLMLYFTKNLQSSVHKYLAVNIVFYISYLSYVLFTIDIINKYLIQFF